jgi:hypothetical protein
LKATIQGGSERDVNASEPIKNAGEPRSDDDVQKLRDLVDGNTPTQLIGLKLSRTETQHGARRRAQAVAGSAISGPYGDMS